MRRDEPLLRFRADDLRAVDLREVDLRDDVFRRDVDDFRDVDFRRDEPLLFRRELVLFLRDLPLRFGGTLSPSRRASASPIAIACFRLFAFG